MRLPGLKTVRQAARWLRSRTGTGALILGYHRICEPAPDHPDLQVSPDHFAEQLAVLQRDACPMPLCELADALGQGRLPPRAVALTFDDGYADTFHAALPALERFQIPATLFVTTGYLGREFWWEELGRLLPHTAAEASGEQPPLIGLPAAGPREQAYARYQQRLLRLPAAEREALLASLRAHTPPGPAPRRPSSLTSDELVQLAHSRLIGIGSHTVTHPALAMRSLPEQRWEIETSKRHLESLLSRPVTALSYPHGSQSPLSRTLAQAAGYRFACGSSPDVCRPGSDRFNLPRFWVPDWGGARFGRWLGHWLTG